MIKAARDWGKEIIGEIGAEVVFAGEVFGILLRHGTRVSAVIDQMFAVGVRSLSTVVATALFVGAIMAIQINLQLRDFGAQAFIGGLSTSVTIRDVGPLLIAFLLSGKVGAYTSAELGTMQVTDQLNAIRCLGTNPIEYIVVPRLLAVVISSFLLLIIGLVVTMTGGAVFASVGLGINTLNYIQNIPRLVTGWSIAVGVVKSFCFGLLMAVIACYRGYTAKGGSSGVGETVRRTSVQTLLTIIVVDFAISSAAGFLQELLGVGIY